MTYKEAADAFEKLCECNDAGEERCIAFKDCKFCELYVTGQQEIAAIKVALKALRRMMEMDDDGK